MDLKPASFDDAYVLLFGEASPLELAEECEASDAQDMEDWFLMRVRSLLLADAGTAQERRRIVRAAFNWMEELLDGIVEAEGQRVARRPAQSKNCENTLEKSRVEDPLEAKKPIGALMKGAPSEYRALALRAVADHAGMAVEYEGRHICFTRRGVRVVKFDCLEDAERWLDVVLRREKKRAVPPP
jgi:hypothetical protein